MTLARRALAGSALLVGALIAGSRCSPPSESNSTHAGPSGPGFGVAGYLVPWDSQSRVSAAAGRLVELSPVWYQPTDTGAIVYVSKQAASMAATVNAEATAHGASLTPSISNFRNGRWDGALIAALVTDRGRRAAHVAAIVDLARSRHWPAIDIDYESLPASARASYSAFVAELAAALHRAPARLSVTVHAKTAEPGDWPGARAQDWHAIGAAADEVRVMAYDYSYSSSRPGPIAPASWVGRVLGLATKLMPRERIVLGVPTYGYDWAPGTDGTAVRWTDVQAIVRAHEARQRWDAASSSPWLKYVDDQGREHTVWYENARSVAAKLDVAQRYGVKHVVLWRLGGEDPGIWPILHSPRDSFDGP